MRCFLNWYDNAVVYHIYPLGYCGCPKDNGYSPAASGQNPILSVLDHLPLIKEQGFNTVFFGPVFQSAHHGYDTADFGLIDSRLGSNADFALVCQTAHDLGLRVIIDGVFNHVGRDFWAFADVRNNKFNSRYKDWFYIRQGDSNYNDGFYYEGWEGHYELVKLNLKNPDMRDHIFENIRKWRAEFGIDGLRLDVAYCLDLDFLRELRGVCKSLLPDFWLMGEILHGDYNTWCNGEMLDSVTNYECYKGLYSSFNALNMFEIAYSLNRQFGSEHWCIYRGKQLYIFADNHDVSRIATILKEKRHLPALYALMFTMPGVPGVYYGSEYGIEGSKAKGDDDLRRQFILAEHQPSALTNIISRLARAHAAQKPLYAGDYRQVYLQNQQFCFARSADGQTVYTFINASSAPALFNIGAPGTYYNIMADSGEAFDLTKPFTLPAFGCAVMTTVKPEFSPSAPLETAETPTATPTELKQEKAPSTQTPAKNPIKKPKAVIFDMDGVIMDSESVYYSLARALRNGRELYANLRDEDILGCIGITMGKSREIYVAALGEENARRFERELNINRIAYRDRYGIAVKHGLIELLDYLNINGIPFAIATSTDQRSAYAKLAYARILSLFYGSVIVTAEDYTGSKPEPIAFITAARKLGVDIKDCLIFEDSPNGLLAAKASGAQFIRVKDIVPVPADIAALADAEVTDLSEAIKLIGE
jgi:HAD superfamily hydrolase (TIGR01509 family)